MRTELWGLRDKATHEPIYTYWAASNKYRALFVQEKMAKAACRNPMNPNMEPFCITGDPIRAVGGCRCGECRYSSYDTEYNKRWCNHDSGCREVKTDGSGFCDLGLSREAQDDG